MQSSDVLGTRGQHLVVATEVERVKQGNTKPTPRLLTQLDLSSSIQEKGRASGGSEPPLPQSSYVSWRRSSTSPITQTSMSAASWQPGSTSQKPGYRYNQPRSPPPPQCPWGHGSWSLRGCPVQIFPLAFSHKDSHIC